MSPQVTIDHGGGSTETISSTVDWRWEREIGVMSKLVITVQRSDAQAVTLNRKTDTIDLAGVATGYPLVDYNTGGATWKLIAYSPEWYGKTVEPTAAGVKTTDTDDALITSFVNDVPEWSAGTINEVTGSFTLVSNHAQPHERARKVEQQTSGELYFNGDGSVDYVDSLGTDKSASITLQPGNDNLDGDIRVENRGRKIDATHVKVIGAHEGEAQFYANLVPSGDGRSYDNRVDYTTSRWSDAGDDDWTRWSNKEAATQSQVDAIAEQLAGDITATHVECKATVVGEDLVLGDTVQVTKSEAGIDRKMRVIRIVSRPPSDTASGEVDEVLLSTRSVARQRPTDEGRTLNRFTVAFQGSAVWGTPSGGYQAVTSSENYRLTFFYPNVEFEHLSELYVESQPYRTFHSGAASGGGSLVTSDNNTEFTEAVFNTGNTHSWTGDGTFETIDTLAPNSDTAFALVSIWLDSSDSSTSLMTPTLRVRNQSTGETFRDFVRLRADGNNDGTNFSGDNSGVILVPINMNTGDTYAAEVEGTNGVDFIAGVTWTGAGPHTHNVDVSKHTHDPEPGVIEFGSTTASGVDVIVNGGTPVASDIGSGTFQTTVDISGELTKGAFNTIELTSDSTGWLYATAGLEAYRQLGSQ